MLDYDVKWCTLKKLEKWVLISSIIRKISYFQIKDLILNFVYIKKSNGVLS